MRAIDRATSERFGVPSLALMENAGAAVAEHVFAHHGAARRIVVFCGKGNNGGDGFVAARRLHQKGKTVQVILLASPAELKGDAAIMFGKLPTDAITVTSSEDLKSDRVRALAAGRPVPRCDSGHGFHAAREGPIRRSDRDYERERVASDCRRHSIRCRCRCDDSADGNVRARGFDRHIHGGTSSPCFQPAHRWTDVRGRNRIARRGDRFVAPSECDDRSRLRTADCAASGGVEQGQLWTRVGDRRISRQSGLGRNGRDVGAASRRGAGDGRHSEVCAANGRGVLSGADDRAST